MEDTTMKRKLISLGIALSLMMSVIAPAAFAGTDESATTVNLSAIETKMLKGRFPDPWKRGERKAQRVDRYGRQTVIMKYGNYSAWFVLWANAQAYTESAGSVEPKQVYVVLKSDNSYLTDMTITRGRAEVSCTFLFWGHRINSFHRVIYAFKGEPVSKLEQTLYN